MKIQHGGATIDTPVLPLKQSPLLLARAAKRGGDQFPIGHKRFTDEFNPYAEFFILVRHQIVSTVATSRSADHCCWSGART